MLRRFGCQITGIFTTCRSLSSKHGVPPEPLPPIPAARPIFDVELYLVNNLSRPDDLSYFRNIGREALATKVFDPIAPEQASPIDILIRNHSTALALLWTLRSLSTVPEILHHFLHDKPWLLDRFLRGRVLVQPFQWNCDLSYPFGVFRGMVLKHVLQVTGCSFDYLELKSAAQVLKFWRAVTKSANNLTDEQDVAMKPIMLLVVKLFADQFSFKDSEKTEWGEGFRGVMRYCATDE